jgi:hypothetical protein
MTNNPNCVILGTNASVIDLNGSFLYNSNLPLEDKEIRERLPESPFFHSSTVFRKDCFFKAGGYPEHLSQYFDDKILWNNMAKFGGLNNLSYPLINYRIVPTSMSNLNHKKIKKSKEIANRIINNNNHFQTRDLEELNKIMRSTSNERYGNYFLKIGSIYLKNNNRSLSAKNLLKSLFYSPFNIDTLVKLVACFFPYSIIKKIGNR